MVMKVQPSKPWSRRPGESAEAHSAFLEYRNIRSKRSISLVSQKCNKHASILGRWSTKWAWVDRARAWDDHIQAARDEVRLAHVAKWEQRRMAAVEEAWTTGEALHQKALKMLGMPLVEKRVEKDGKTTVLKAGKWSFQTVTEMLRLAHDLRIMSTGSAVKPAEQCDDEELAALEEAHYKALGAGTPDDDDG
jgi:hypothetical protein